MLPTNTCFPFTLAAGFTWEVRVRSSPASASPVCLFALTNSTSPNLTLLNGTYSGNGAYYANSISQSTVDRLILDSPLLDDVEYHIMCAFSPRGTVCTVDGYSYVPRNFQLDTTWSFVRLLVGPTGFANGTALKWTGTIALMAFYNRTLAFEELIQNYNAGMANRRPVSTSTSQSAMEDVASPINITACDADGDIATVRISSLP